jgi:transcription elongation factor Elf1
MVSEQTFDCPYCGEPVSCVIDGSAGAQSYVEDCEVCCQPIEISCDFDLDGQLEQFQARRSDD